MSSKIDFVNILRTALNVVRSPARFFKEMPKTGGYIEPLVFMVVMGFIGSFAQAVLSIVGLAPKGPEVGAVFLIIMLTIIIVVSGFVAAGIYFIIWRLMGSHESFETAYRCNAYISALIPITALFSAVPYLDQVIAIALTTLFLVIASVQVHNLPLKKAWFVFGILGVIFLMISITGEIVLERLEETAKDTPQEYIQKLRHINKKINLHST